MKLRLILVCLAAAAFVACSPNGGQIYSIIENEKQAVDSTLPSPKTQTVANVVSTGSGGPYYVAMGAIFRGVAKSDGTIDWTGGTGGSAVAVGAPAAGASCNAMAYYGGHLWGGFVTAGTVLGLYESTTVSGAETFAGAQAVTDPSVQGLQIALIQVANGNLFVVTATVSGTDYVYNLVFYNGTTWFPVTSLTGVSAPITGVGWDGTQYWAVSSGTLQGTQTVAPVIYTGTAASPPAFTAYGAPGSYTIATTDIIHGLFASQTPLGIVILCTKNEGVYYLYGGTWYHLTDVQSSINVGFLCATASYDSAGDVLVGSDGYGYYLLSPGTQGLTRPSDAINTTIALHTSAVSSILVDPSQPTSRNRVFMGTAGAGLWRSAFDPTTGAPDSNGWTHE